MAQAYDPPAKLVFFPDAGGIAAYVALHLGCLGVFFTGNLRLGLTVGAVTFLLRMFLLSAAYHRYFAHRAFQTSRFVQAVLAGLGALTMQRGPLWWASTHRTHHQHADTEHDLHSPRYHGFFYAYSGWFLNTRNARTDWDKVRDLAVFPELRLLDTWPGYSAPVALYALLLYYFLGWTGLVWGWFVSTALLLHVTHWIQSFSHSWGGYRRFDTRDSSRNHWLLGVVSLGEWHNNHHHRPASARQGAVWWEPDLTYVVLRLLESLGIIWNLKRQL